ncbi:MAG: AAA family ATPase, partial [bacterium]|nr:AAA family ATPase [bacterium]
MEFLNGLRTYVKNIFPMFLQSAESDPEQHQQLAKMFLPFEVNVYVDNSDVKDVPIIAENITKLSDFVGGTDYVISQGVAYTDHMKIHPGLLARANGGYLVMNADKFLVIPGLFEAFMNALESKKVFAEQSRGLFASSHLEPEPITLNVRVILFGEITRLLHQFPGFSRLFSTHAHIEPFVERTPLQIAGYRSWILGLVEKEKLRKIAPNAVCNLIEHAGRLAHNQKYLSTDFESLAHVLREAGTIAEQLKAPSIASKHIRRALQERFWRSSFSYEYLQGMVQRGEILIDAKGEYIGQNNALAVHSISRGIAVGFPTRVTGTASVGKPGLTNVHVLAKMGGNLVQKADQTVEGFLKHKFAREAPLALGVTLSFEQTYGMIDGDSASLVSLFVALSSISQVSLKQVGITGSMNLHGKVQPIGGVNEKIEGYFDTCCALGCLDGSQGVIIPWQNKENLMLRFDVVVAIRKGKFNVWPIKTIEEGIEILTGMEAGTPDESGVYPENTFYKRVADQVKKFRENAVKFYKESEPSQP